MSQCDLQTIQIITEYKKHIVQSLNPTKNDCYDYLAAPCFLRIGIYYISIYDRTYDGIEFNIGDVFINSIFIGTIYDPRIINKIHNHIRSSNV